MLTTRSEWRTKVKAKFGVPDGVCSFSIGERIESWNKKLTAADKDHKAKLVAVDGLLKDLKAYDAALKGVKPSKFKGKTQPEQLKNLQDTQHAVHAEVTSYENLRSGIAALANPLDTLKQNLKAAKSKLNSIAKNDLDALKDFYSADYRNQVGKFVKVALTHNPTGKLKTALEAYVNAGDEIDGMVDNCASTDLVTMAKIYAACKIGVEGLSMQL